MLKKTLQDQAGPGLTWYTEGSGERQVVVLSPPGMSVRHWVPALGQIAPDCRLLIVNYRGFDSEGAPQAAELCTFERCLDDVEAVLRAAGVERAHFVTWCAGSWLARALHDRNPALMQSLVAIGVGRGDERGKLTDFEQTVSEIQKMLEADPRSVDRILLRMRRLGLFRDEAYYQAIYDAGDGAAGKLEQVPGADVASGGLAFSLFDTPERLLGYVRLFRSFQDNFRRLGDIGVPLTLIEGRLGHPSAGEPPVRREQLHDAAWLLSLQQKSEFILLEHPSVIVEEIREHWRERCGACSAASRPGHAAPRAREVSYDA